VGDLMLRTLYADMPRRTVQEWQELVTEPEHLQMLWVAEAITDRLYKAPKLYLPFSHPVDGEQVRFNVEISARGVGGLSFYEVKHNLFIPFNSEVKEELVSYYDTAIDAGVVQFAVLRAVEFTSSDAQLAKLWPQLATLAEATHPILSQDARVAARRARLSPVPEELREIIDFAQHQLAMAALLDLPPDEELRSICRVSVDVQDRIKHGFQLRSYPTYTIAPRTTR
jgi:hypothetical protein